MSEQTGKQHTNESVGEFGRRTSVCFGNRVEELFGFSRVVRVGSLVWVAGTTAMGDDQPVGGADIAAQTTECLRRIAGALGQVGARLEHVVRSRLFVTDITSWREVGEVHRSAFAAVPPVSTIVQVSALFDPRLLVEVEVDAYLSDPAAGSRVPDLSDVSA